ncbi:MAG TPA: pyridoxal-phosphate dependent enzyme, partial [Verrucomicrobiae bacterium]|nr:pyridoxal-phosphate dependent enzyme [Verrucomicrobiae bacterium]
MTNFVTHLECANCGKTYDAAEIHNLCTACNRPLWVKYDLTSLKKAFPKEKLKDRPANLWRYMEMLPIKDRAKIVSLDETVSPLLEAKRLVDALGVQSLFVKDESRLPTGSFKARGMAMAISKANEFGIKRV